MLQPVYHGDGVTFEGNSIVNFPFILEATNSESPKLLELSFGYFVLENHFKNLTESLEMELKKTPLEPTTIKCQLWSFLNIPF